MDGSLESVDKDKVALEVCRICCVKSDPEKCGSKASCYKEMYTTIDTTIKAIKPCLEVLEAKIISLSYENKQLANCNKVLSRDNGMLRGRTRRTVELKNSIEPTARNVLTWVCKGDPEAIKEVELLLIKYSEMSKEVL